MKILGVKLLSHSTSGEKWLSLNMPAKAGS